MERFHPGMSHHIPAMSPSCDSHGPGVLVSPVVPVWRFRSHVCRCHAWVVSRCCGRVPSFNHLSVMSLSYAVMSWLVMSLSCALLVCLCRVQACPGHVTVVSRSCHVIHGQLQSMPLHVWVVRRSCQSHFLVRLDTEPGHIFVMFYSSHVAVMSRSCYIVYPGPVSVMF